MKSLLALQRQFQAYVLALEEEVAANVASTARADTSTRLAIYANAYRLRLIAALREDYPKLRKLLGAGSFDQLARTYVAHFPSQHPNIRWFGQQLPALLRAQPPYRDKPVLAEMAAFELALRNAFDAADAKVLPLDAVAAIPPQAWPTLRPTLHPSVQRLDLAWNAVAIWQALNRGQSPIAPQRMETPIPWVVWRKGLNPNFRSLDAGEARALDAIIDGADVQTLCESASNWYAPEEIPALVGRWLKTWLADGMVISIR